ncbi:hypothetical protein [Hymenobacter swuensis]|uniref:Uncharacterized protein n=1 Tax=Hymenobacter swuensis DY53 TaxID=1227739 RepID=W8F890_9BACT|nr:hypothetical protein [Hymenobacter swuensis]AHJ98841.1 hypothetical protein Hsw_3246 [Hymenobacter swuensis DY53]
MAAVSWLDAQVARLWRFGCHTVLPAVPRSGWLVVGLFGFGLLNLGFEREIWPHHPQADIWFGLLLCSCGLMLPWQSAATARRVSQVVVGSWQLLWQLLAWMSYAAAVLVSIPALIGFILCLMKVFR